MKIQSFDKNFTKRMKNSIVINEITANIKILIDSTISTDSARTQLEACTYFDIGRHLKNISKFF